MPFDVFTMAAMRDEIDETVEGARVDKVIQPSERSIALQLWRPGWSGHLVMSAAGSDARAYLSAAKLSKAFETPTPFLMLLRKYCTGGRIEATRQAHLDRVLFLDVHTGEHGTTSLVLEVMGNRSNLIAIDGGSTILNAIKLIGPHQSRTRRILPHGEYHLPPGQARDGRFGDGPKVDPLSTDGLAVIESLLNEVAGQIPLRDALLGLLQGCSPAVATDIASLTNLDAQVAISIDHVPLVVQAIATQYDLLRSCAWKPVVVLKDDRSIDFKAYEPPSAGAFRRMDTMSAAIEEVTASMESSDALQGQRRRLHGEIRRRLNFVESRIASLERGLASASDADRYQETGNLILGFQYGITPGDKELVIPEMERRIELDPQRSPVENAERYFKRYRKARDAAKRVPALLETAGKEREHIAELDLFIDLAETPSELARIESEVIVRKKPSSSQKQKAPAVGKILSVDLGGSRQALIGRSARQNEEVTFRLAGRGDLWFHAREVPGAHVVLRSQGGQPQEDAIDKAAQLAAYYSKARNEGAADVIVARVRDVRRFPGGAPGQVTVRNERIVRVKPAPASEVGAAQ